MNKSNNRKNYGTAYYAMAFLAAFIFEFYWIMVNPYEHFMLIGIGAIMLIMGYLTVDSILKAKADADAARNEQNDMMLKAQKAIYIATKKNAKDAETSQLRNIKAMEIMMNKMISSQQALLEDKNAGKDDMSSLIDQLSASNAKLAKEVQSAITVNQLVKANADLVKNVKDALNAAANNNSSTGDLSSYVNEVVGAVSNPAPSVTPIPQPVVQPTPAVEPQVSIPEMEVKIPEMNVEIPAMEVETPEMNVEIPAMEVEIPEMNVEIPAMEVEIPEIEIPEVEVPDIEIPEINIPEVETPELDLSDAFAAMENEINMAEMAASEAMEELVIPDEMTPELEEAMVEVNPEEIIMEPESPFTMPTDDNPNKQLTEEEIAALFASL